MLGMGWQEILVIVFIIALIVGAKRLPEIGTGLGKTVKEIRKIRDDRKADKTKGKENQKTGLLAGIKRDVEEIPGLKEAKEVKETVDKVRSATKFLK